MVLLSVTFGDLGATKNQPIFYILRRFSFHNFVIFSDKGLKFGIGLQVVHVPTYGC